MRARPAVDWQGDPFEPVRAFSCCKCKAPMGRYPESWPVAALCDDCKRTKVHAGWTKEKKQR